MESEYLLLLLQHPTLNSIQSQLPRVRAFTSWFLQTHFNIIPLFNPISFK